MVGRESVGLTVVSRLGLSALGRAWQDKAGLRPVIDSAFSLLFPADCRICFEPLVRASRLPVCEPCRDSIVAIEGNRCRVCGERLFSFSRNLAPHAGDADGEVCGLCRRAAPAFTRAVAYGAFEDALREAVHLLKYDRVLPAAKFLGAKLSLALTQLPAEGAGGWVVVPVPLHARRLRQRGFNQAELIARAALRDRAGGAGFHLHTKCLVRQRETVPQAGLTRRQRRENIRGAFVVRDAAVVLGRDVLLMDDVFTTGTTIAECARVLLRAGAARVCAATVARVLKADRIGKETAGMERAAA